MYVINEETKIVNIWENSEINRQRLASGKYGVVEYTGEVETGYDDRLYAQGHAPVKPEPTYIELRLKEYPPLGEQLDMIYHNLDDWKAKISEIKAKYPKESI